MDLTNYTTDELREKLSNLDETKSPHEALALSNELGRRTTDYDEIITEPLHALQFVKLAPRIAILSITLLIFSFFNDPPKIHAFLITMGVSILFTISCVRIWRKHTLNLKMGFLVIFIILFNLTNEMFKKNELGWIQHISVIGSVFSISLILFRDRLINLFKQKL